MTNREDDKTTADPSIDRYPPVPPDT